MTSDLKLPEFIAYCDEAGDPGLTNKASDWFIASAVVVRAANIPLSAGWIADIKRPMKAQKTPELHFRKLSDGMKSRACTMLAALPVRAFTVTSHKANMRNYRNPAAEYALAKKDFRDDGTLLSMEPQNGWFHNWMLKVLVERVTDWCARRSIREYGHPRSVSFCIASRDGFYLKSFVDYLKLDQERERTNSAVLRYHPDWRVVDWELFDERRAAAVPGLQLADVVCGSFLHAVDKRRFGKCNSDYAKLIEPIMAQSNLGARSGYSVTRWPWHWWKSDLPEDHTDIFRHYGYKEGAPQRLGRPNYARRGANANADGLIASIRQSRSLFLRDVHTNRWSED